MSKNVFGIGVAVVLLAISNVWGEEIDYSIEWSGSFVDTAIDTNGDGTFANLVLIEAKGTLGPQTIQALWEVAVLGPTANCGGLYEIDYVLNTVVTRFANGDVIFSKLTDGSGCMDPATGRGTGGGKYTIVGGTGRFKGATGETQDRGMSIALEANLTDPLNPVAFGAMFGESWGTIYTVDE